MSLNAHTLYRFGPFELNPARRVLLRGGETVPLNAKAFETLLALVERHGRVVGKDELMGIVWPDSFVEEANLAQNISAVRKALGESPGENRFIATLPGKGYQFICELAPLEPSAAPNLVPAATPETPGHRPEQPSKPARVGWRALLLVGFALGSLAAVIGFAFHRPTPVHALTRSIAVLPFQPLSASGGSDSLGLGVTDAVITRLSNLPQLVVRPTSEVLRYSASPVDPVKAGHELSVESVLDGKVQRLGDHIRVTVQLVNVADGHSMWAGTVDETFTNIFGVEDTIAEKVNQALVVHLDVPEQHRLSRHYTDNIQAYRDYMEGRYFEFQFTPDGLHQAIDRFGKAIEIDGKYALAYAGLADAYTTASEWILKPLDAIPRAEQAARKAVQCDDGLAEAHGALAHALLHDWKLREAGAEFQRAIALGPNNTSTYFAFGEYLATAGDLDGAAAELNKALRVDPLSPEINGLLSWVAYLKRDYGEEMRRARIAVDLHGADWDSHMVLASACLMTKQYGQALEELGTALHLNPDSPLLITLKALAENRLGNLAAVARELDRLKALSKTQYVSPAFLAQIYADGGDRDEAFRWLDRAYEDRTEGALWLDLDPLFDNLHGDPRYAALVKKINRAHR